MVHGLFMVAKRWNPDGYTRRHNNDRKMLRDDPAVTDRANGWFGMVNGSAITPLLEMPIFSCLELTSS